MSLNAATAKPHLPTLDGLRGVASLTVVLFHLCESYQNDPIHQLINHGYLAVDFFFMLSGFVVAYAYDGRWRVMTIGEFCKRRLIRLQPMVVVGSILGALLFYAQGSPQFSLVQGTPLSKMLLLLVLGAAMIPVTPSLDIRGWKESYPLNGPAWSLMFEYIANLLYAVGLRRLSNKALFIFVLIAGGFLTQLALTTPRHSLAGGWSIDSHELYVGFARVLFPFFAGVLLMRTGLRVRTSQPFLTCSVILVGALSLPHLSNTLPWMNGLYEAMCVILLFPLIIVLGAGADLAETGSIRVARFFGELSYPLYITHYPLIYVYAAWILRHHPSLQEALLAGAAVLALALLVASISLRLFDVPVRRWLSEKWS